MKEKIYQSLKQTFSSKYGVNDVILLGLAESLAATGVITEENLATVVRGQESVLRAYQQNFDRVRKEGSDYKKELDELKAKVEKPIEKPVEKPADDMAKIIADAVSAAVKPLSDKLTQFESEKSQATRQEQIATKAKEYGVPETILPMLKIADDADLDTYFKDAKQTFANEGFKGVVSPDSSEQNLEKETSAYAKMISDGTKEIVEQQKQ